MLTLQAEGKSSKFNFQSKFASAERLGRYRRPGTRPTPAAARAPGIWLDLPRRVDKHRNPSFCSAKFMGLSHIRTYCSRRQVRTYSSWLSPFRPQLYILSFRSCARGGNSHLSCSRAPARLSASLDHTAFLAKPSKTVYWTLVQCTVRPFFCRKELDQQEATRQGRVHFLRRRVPLLLESDLVMNKVAKRLLRFDSKQSKPSAAEPQPNRIISRKDAKAAKFGDYG